MKQTYFTILFLLVPIISFADNIINVRFENLLSHGKNKEVISLADSLMKQNNKKINTTYYLAKAHEGLMHYDKAYSYYSILVEKDSMNLDNLQSLAKVAYNCGRINEAEQLYLKLFKDDTLSFNANYQLGRIYQLNGNSMKAVPYYNNCLKSDSLNISVLNNIGDCYAEYNLFPGAIGSYCLALEQNPHNVPLAVKTVNFVILNYKQLPDSLATAEYILEQSLNVNPKSQPLLRSLGILKFIQRNFNYSDSLFTNLIKSGDSVRSNFKYLGLSRFLRGQFMNSLEPLYIADSLFTNDQGLHTDIEISLCRAEALTRCGERKMSMDLLNEIEEQLQPNEATIARIFRLRGLTFETQGKYIEARNNYWKAYSTNSSKENLIKYAVCFNHFFGLDNKFTLSEKEYDECILAAITFLKLIPDRYPDNGTTQHAFFRKLIYRKSEEMFMTNQNAVSLSFPDNVKKEFTREQLNEMIKMPEEVKE
ncbi:MAG: hypothetical protein Q4F97_11415 [Bacteroidales bacterium]|nr:hypothetical protein [Bacteroidales bacterium]